ncbi:MAG: cysteine desulfurase [Campylobacterota bacterium]
MTKLNLLQYKNMDDLYISKELSLSILSDNQTYLNLEDRFKSKYAFDKLITFSFCQDGFLGLLLHLNKKGTIAVSLGETQSLIDACEVFESLGFEIVYLPIKKDGKIEFKTLKEKDVDFLFLSSYVMDTFVTTNIEDIKKITHAKIISNASAHFSSHSDALYFDSYKLTGYFTSGVLLFDDGLFESRSIGFIDTVAVNSIFEALNNQSFENSMQDKFKKKLKDIFGDDIYFFVDSEDTLSFTLHFALKDIKARELVRTLGFEQIHITNGEGCSLGLSKPSRIIQHMGYDEDVSRNALSLSFDKKLDDEVVTKTVETIAKKYRQIKVLNEQ